MESWLQTARRPEILRRGLKVGLLVGTLLMLINQGDLILAGRLDLETMLKIVLTYCVPFGVATYAGCAALRERLREQQGQSPEPD